MGFLLLFFFFNENVLRFIADAQENHQEFSPDFSAAADRLRNLVSPTATPPPPPALNFHGRRTTIGSTKAYSPNRRRPRKRKRYYFQYLKHYFFVSDKPLVIITHTRVRDKKNTNRKINDHAILICLTTQLYYA